MDKQTRDGDGDGDGDTTSPPPLSTMFNFPVVSDGTLESLIQFTGVAPASFSPRNSNPPPYIPMSSGELKVPKPEPFWREECYSTAFPTDAQPIFEFLSNCKASPDLDHDSLTFNHLPYLHSLEQPQALNHEQQIHHQLTDLSSHKRFRFDSSPSPRYNHFSPGDSSSSRVVVEEQKKVKRQQLRQTIGEKTRCLAKLMPWDTKMNTATLLEEAHKYVSYLQSQISALQSMPVESSFRVTPQVLKEENRMFANLGRLNRQQLLQIVVNSPSVQTLLSSEGCCVVSLEQLISSSSSSSSSSNKNSQRRGPMQRLLLD